MIVHAIAEIEIHSFPEDIIQPDATIIKGLNNLIEKYFKENKTTTFYADQLSLSTKVLNTKVKKLTGKTLYELIRYRIIKEAVLLLLYTDKSIKEISYELGMYDPSYFSRFFKKITGMQPKQYKKSRNYGDFLT
jgi:AraC-like DNA-binding protein